MWWYTIKSFWFSSAADNCQNRLPYWKRSAVLIVLIAYLLCWQIGLYLKDLADRSDVSVTVLSQVFTTWIILLEKELEPLNPIPSRDVTVLTLPAVFKKLSKISCTTDCTELFIERAFTLTGHSLTYSSYKYHRTVKFLVAVVPTGAICYGYDISQSTTLVCQLTVTVCTSNIILLSYSKRNTVEGHLHALLGPSRWTSTGERHSKRSDSGLYNICLSND